MDAISCKFSAQEADQGESSHAIERMDADLLIGPMEARIPAEEVRVFHLTESMFDVVLGSISADNPFISPFVIGTHFSTSIHVRALGVQNQKAAVRVWGQVSLFKFSEPRKLEK